MLRVRTATSMTALSCLPASPLTAWLSSITTRHHLICASGFGLPFMLAAFVRPCMSLTSVSYVVTTTSCSASSATLRGRLPPWYSQILSVLSASLLRASVTHCPTSDTCAHGERSTRVRSRACSLAARPPLSQQALAAP